MYLRFLNIFNITDFFLELLDLNLWPDFLNISCSLGFKLSPLANFCKFLNRKIIEEQEYLGYNLG